MYYIWGVQYLAEVIFQQVSMNLILHFSECSYLWYVTFGNVLDLADTVFGQKC